MPNVFKVQPLHTGIYKYIHLAGELCFTEFSILLTSCIFEKHKQQMLLSIAYMSYTARSFRDLS